MKQWIGCSLWFASCAKKNVFGIICFFAAGSALAADHEIVFPGVEWSQSAPKQQEMDSTVLDRLAEQIGGRGVVIRNGHVVKSWGAEQRRGDWYGSSNPLFSSLLFFAIEEGRVGGIQERAGKYLWDFDSKDREIQFSQLANMTSGYARPEPSGEAWAYSNFGVQLFQMTLLDRVFNQPPLSVMLGRNRLGSLKFQDRPALRERTNTLVASARDFGRIAWFWCQKGKWGDRQLLPKHYFDRFMRPHVKIDQTVTLQAEDNDYLQIGTERDESEYFGEHGPGIYGYGWWFNAKGRQNPDQVTWPSAPLDTVMSIGIRGNNAVIIPSLNLVLVSTYSKWGDFTPGDADSLYNRYIENLVNAVKR
jgi:CubicO group peptidase (beta-lactamase class C family)